MDKNKLKQETTNTDIPVKVLPVPHYVLDGRNFRSYNAVYPFALPVNFVLDVNLTQGTFFELKQFKGIATQLQNSDGLFLSQSQMVGEYTLSIYKVDGPAETLLGAFHMGLPRDEIKDKHLIWDGDVFRTLRFKITKSSIVFSSGILLPGSTYDPIALKMILDFDFIDYPKSLYGFRQSPTINI